MVKKGIFEKYQTLIIGGIGIVVLYFIASSGMLSTAFSFGGTTFEGFNFPGMTGTPLAPLQPETEFLSYSAIVDIQPNPLCLGNTLTATINTNIPNGVCSIYANSGTGFAFFSNIFLDGSGNFTITDTPLATGTIVFRTICCDAERNCKIAPDLSFTVTTAIPPCPPPGPPPPADSDGDGFTDAEEEAAGTDPYDADDYPGSDGNGEAPNGYTCGLDTSCYNDTCPTDYICSQIDSEIYGTWCACINEALEIVHIDWKPGGAYYNPWN